eukprot:9914913-Lingulodinium_polyedra.AAC.1
MGGGPPKGVPQTHRFAALTEALGIDGNALNNYSKDDVEFLFLRACGCRAADPLPEKRMEVLRFVMWFKE